MRNLHAWKLGVGFFAVLATDQLSKFIAQYFDLVSYNKGFSLGFGGFLPFPIIAVVVLVTLGIWMRWIYPRKVIPVWVIGGFSGAVVSNLCDRMWFGGVRDFLPLLFGIHNNLADWVIGLTLLWIVYKEFSKPAHFAV
jgi:lipoprotein signal peptidase